MIVAALTALAAFSLVRAPHTTFGVHPISPQAIRDLTLNGLTGISMQVIDIIVFYVPIVWRWPRKRQAAEIFEAITKRDTTHGVAA